MDYLLAHDVGTTGTKAALVTTDGRVVATAFEPYPIRYPRPNWAEQDPEDWWRALGITTRQVLEKSGSSPQQVLSLSFSTQMLNTIALDSQNQMLYPCISWMDARAGEEAGLVMRKLGGPALFTLIVGSVLTGKDVLPKHLWLKRHEPQIYQKASVLLDCSGYLLWRTTGRLVTELSVSSVTGLLNLKKKTWDTGLIRLMGLDASKYPELVRSFDKVGGLTREAASNLGLLEGTPVFGGAGDAMSAAVGSGAVCDTDGHLSLGTSGFFGMITSRQVVGRSGAATLQSAEPAKFLLIGEMETCAESLKWAASALYGMQPDGAAMAHMDSEVASTAPGSGGLIFTPWMYGERCPIPDESVRAGFINLSANHTRPQMARAVYEGVAYNFRWILELVDHHYHFKPDTLRVIGGGARGKPWLRIIADVTGRSLEVVPNPQEASAVGAALVAAIGLGIIPDFDAVKPLVPVVDMVRPDPAAWPAYEEQYATFKQVYPALKRLYHNLYKSK